MNELLLEANGVQKAFNGVAALADGRLALRSGTVHALCGGNGAGKSTFLNIVMGMLRRDAGSIRLKGREVDFSAPSDALENRIAIITQELSPIPGMSVAENIYLGRAPRRAGICLNFKQLFRQAEQLLTRLQFDINPRALMSSLSLAQVQLVEIAKAFSHDCDVMIMDEPTSAIGERETEVLFNAIRNLTRQGAGIIYVSHRLSEIFQIADEYTVFRDGCFVDSGHIAAIDRSYLVSAIVGRQLEVGDRARRVTGKPVLETDKLSRDGEFQDISLTVHQGEVLGIYGLMGAGRSEFLNCIYGLQKPDSGCSSLNGNTLPEGNPKRAIQAGLSLVTEDRKETGLVLGSSIRDNISLAALPRLSFLGLVRKKGVSSLVEEMVRRMQMKVSSAALPVASMSGGNQQKVVLARCFSTSPICLLCDEPTRGIDEGAKREVYKLLDAFALDGGAVMLVSSEAQEILDTCDRIAVFKTGRLVSIIDCHGSSQEELLHLAS